MKILATVPSKYGSNGRAIVELSEDELNRIVNGSSYGHSTDRRFKFESVTAGQIVELCQRFDTALAIERKVSEAISMPAMLRSFADVLDQSVKLLKESVIPPEVVSQGGDT